MEEFRNIPYLGRFYLSQLHVKNLTGPFPGLHQPTQGIQNLGKIVVGLIFRGQAEERGTFFQGLDQSLGLLGGVSEDGAGHIHIGDRLQVQGGNLPQRDVAGFPGVTFREELAVDLHLKKLLT